MRAFRQHSHNLLCLVLIAALLAQCSVIAFAADPETEIYHLEGGIPDESGAWTPEYWVDSHGNRDVQTTSRVRAAAELPSSYDLRDEGLVTSVKHQAGSEACWAFSPIASLESSYIKQEFGTTADTDFSEAHLTWFGQHERTTDTADPTYGDGLEREQAFRSGGNWMMSSSQLLRGSGLQLEQNAPWITTYDAETLMQMAQPESERYACYARMWSARKIVDNSPETLKQLILQNGAATLSYYDNYTEYQKLNDTAHSGYSSNKYSYYQTAQTNKTNHTVAVVGWDDDYPCTNFNENAQPTSNGAWLVKGSWSIGWGNRGYYWISYQDPSLDSFVSFVAAPADIYDHIYQYDGAFPSVYLSVNNSAAMANVFTAQRDELLTHVAFLSLNTSPVRAIAEVYVAPDDFVYSGLHPFSGMEKVSAATTTVSGVEYGYSTVELQTPVRLSEGQMFSVVLTMENSGAKVRIPVEGSTVNNPADGVKTYSGSFGQSFYKNSTGWYDTKACVISSKTYDYNNVPLKAMTRDIHTSEPTLTIADAPDKTTYLVGEMLDTTGLSLVYTDEWGDAQTVSEGYTCDPDLFCAAGTQTVTVTYNDLSAAFDVTVEPNELAPVIRTLPDKLTYLVGETLDTTGMSLRYTDELGETHQVSEGFSCDPTTLSEIGTQTVRVFCNGFFTSFDVTVEPYEPTLTILTLPDKTTYRVGDTLDMTGFSLVYTDEYGISYTVTDGYTYDPQTLSEIGGEIVSVFFNGLFVTFTVTVDPYEPTLTIRSMPDKTAYFTGESLDTTGLSLLYTDEYGDAFVVTEGFICDPAEFRSAGEQTVTVTYNDLSAAFDVSVEQRGVFVVSDAAARAGETVEVAVRIRDNPGIVSTWLELDYDADVLELADVRNGEIFADDCFTPGNDLTEIPYRVLFLDALARDNYTQDGDLVIFTFRVRTDAPAGESTISVTYNEESTFDADLQSVPFVSQDGTFTVQRLPGDVNADGIIDMKDVVMLRRYLADWDVTVNLSNADVDMLTGVDLRDVAYISRFLAGGYGLTLH